MTDTTTNLYLAADPTAAPFAVSTAVGSGKTRQAIQYMSRPDLRFQNVIYVAPTRVLLKQTEKDLLAALEEQPGFAKGVHLIYSEPADMAKRDDRVADAVLRTINEHVTTGRVVIATTPTFLRILSRIHRKQDWVVILDEAFSPVQFLSFVRGQDPADSWAYFSKMFAVDPMQANRLLPAPGRAEDVQRIAAGDFRKAGHMWKGLKDYAAAVANPAMRCELVEPVTVESLQTTDPTIATFVTPQYFEGFHEVIFMAALFHHTMLYHLWRALFGVTFRKHPDINVDKMRPIHEDQGPHVSIAYVLDPSDSSSLYNLGKNFTTGAVDEPTPGLRVVDRMVQIISDYFGAESFLLQSNSRYGYVEGGPLSGKLVPSNAVLIPTAYFSPSWTAFQADRGRDFKLIVDAVSA